MHLIFKDFERSFDCIHGKKTRFQIEVAAVNTNQSYQNEKLLLENWEIQANLIW